MGHCILTATSSNFINIPENSLTHRKLPAIVYPLSISPTKNPNTRCHVSSVSNSISPTTENSTSCTWDDVVKVSQPDYLADSPSDLNGFFHKVKLCNRNSEMQSEFLPFVIEDKTVGYVHNGFVEHLRSFKDVFSFPEDDCNGSRFRFRVSLHPMLETPEDRTKAVDGVVKCLGKTWFQLFPVTSSFGASVFFSLERAAAPYFGIKAYGVHMNGFVEKGGEKFLWIGKRSQDKPTFPGMLDHLVAGGLPHGIACGDNLIKECEEEAGIPISISKKAKSVGAVSYLDIDGYRYRRDVLFCYDLKLPENFIPDNQDGEVEGFRLISVTNVANLIRRTEFLKPNCSLVIIDFLFRHGYIIPEYPRYLELLQRLRSGDCS